MAALSAQEQLVLATLQQHDGFTADQLADALTNAKHPTTEVEAILHLSRLVRFKLVTRETEPGMKRPTYRVNPQQG